MTRFTRTGKQIMQSGQHMADAVDELAAMTIVNALRALEDVEAKRVAPSLRLNDCRKRREGDEWACYCGLRWAVDDDDPPLCIHRVPR